MKTPESIRHLRIAIILVLSVLVLGTIGYMLIEQFSFADALYTTVDMMATVGSMIRPLSSAGRMFSIIVIVLGVGSLLYTFGAGMEFIIEGHFSQAIRRRLMENKIAALRNHYIICGYGAQQGDATSDDVLREAGIQHAKCLLVATDNDATNISITLTARHLSSKLFIVARANHNETEAKLKL